MYSMVFMYVCLVWYVWFNSLTINIVLTNFLDFWITAKLKNVHMVTYVQPVK